MAVRFKTGDIVKLKSGGPEMTVKDDVEVPGLGFGVTMTEIHCQWFAGNKLQEGHFSEDSLEPVKENEDKK